MFSWIVASILTFGVAQATPNSFAESQAFDLHQFHAEILDQVEIQNLDWTVNDQANYNISMGFISGTMEMLVREEVFEGFWLEQNLDMGFLGKNKVEMLLDKRDGTVLQLIVNGEKQDPPEPGNQEIEEMSEDRITVPAGTYDCVYIKIRDLDQNQSSELWINPSEVPIMGLVKQKAPGQMGEVVVELTGYQMQ